MGVEDVVLVPGLLCDDALWEAQRTALEPHFKVQVARLDQGATIIEIAGHVLAAAAPRFARSRASLGQATLLGCLFAASDGCKALRIF